MSAVATPRIVSLGICAAPPEAVSGCCQGFYHALFSVPLPSTPIIFDQYWLQLWLVYGMLDKNIVRDIGQSLNFTQQNER